MRTYTANYFYCGEILSTATFEAIDLRQARRFAQRNKRSTNEIKKLGLKNVKTEIYATRD